MAYDLQFNLPTKIIFGKNSLESLSEELTGKSVLLVTGRKSMQEAGITGKIIELAGSRSIHIYNKVYGEPDVELIDNGIEFARSAGCDSVIGLGGGSVIDAAKAIAGLLKLEDFTRTADFLEIDGKRKLQSPGIPFIAIPTTAGTGAEVTNNSVLINKKLNNKRSFRSSFLFAKTAIVDSGLTATMPAAIAASSGIDALTHLVEGYIAIKSSILTDSLAMKGIKLIGNSLVNAVKYGREADRENMCLASLLGGIVLVNAGLGLAHGIGPYIGTEYGISHGISVGLVLPHVMEFNLDTDPDKFINIANALGKEGANAGIDAVDAVKNIIREIELPSKLGLKDINNDEIHTLSEKVLTSNSTRKNPKTVTKETVTLIINKIT